MATYLICPHHCAHPYCEVVCPVGAVTIAATEKNVYVDADQCNRCGLCRSACLTFSLDRTLERRRPWVGSDWIALE